MKPANKPEVTNDQILWAMRELGGGFVKGLANLYLLADSSNQQKIRQTWSDYWTKYADFAERMRCPQCGASNILKRYHDGMTCGVPECDFKECEDCGHQWGHC